MRNNYTSLLDGVCEGRAWRDAAEQEVLKEKARYRWAMFADKVRVIKDEAFELKRSSDSGSILTPSWQPDKQEYLEMLVSEMLSHVEALLSATRFDEEFLDLYSLVYKKWGTIDLKSIYWEGVGRSVSSLIEAVLDLEALAAGRDKNRSVIEPILPKVISSMSGILRSIGQPGLAFAVLDVANKLKTKVRSIGESAAFGDILLSLRLLCE